ncbi:MAG: chromosome segregation protein SMC [Gammaproteobacteria bacterium]
MKLEKIKLSGFKSFVDPTAIPVSSNLTAIVGPNGCGKSNIIDAVRWVMGESSAKHLRGGHMADVIFNGSSSRQPVSTATVELLFDNSEGKAGGEFAKFDTISIKRQVSRDGQGSYFLNGSRCRRKDITDLFLGTGLGARSYAIIEQGTISRMVEAKPDDLRGHIEEAAGISKYKERRQETETRMRNTQENLDRLNDVRDEVEKQLKHLQKQAQKAEKYTELKREERQFKLQLLAMRWQGFEHVKQALEEKLTATAEQHNRLFVRLRDIDGQLEDKRSGHKIRQQQLDKVQGEFYRAGSEISRLEQAIRHNERSHQETLLEIERLQQQLAQAGEELQNEQAELQNIRRSLQHIRGSFADARQKEQQLQISLQEQTQQRADWRQRWEEHRNQSARLQEQAEVQRSTIQQLENHSRQLQMRMERLQTERDALDDSAAQTELEALQQTIAELEAEHDDLQSQLQHWQSAIAAQRQQAKHWQDTLHRQRSEAQQLQGRITSLELLQQHAMGKDKQQLNQWLQRLDLQDKPRLAEYLDVVGGWENAVETVLGTYLEALCIDNPAALLEALQTLDNETLSVFETRAANAAAGENSPALPRLLDRVRSQWDLSALLGSVYCADDIAGAWNSAQQLQAHQSIITPDGAWIGPGWLKIVHTSDGKSGVLQREKQLRALKQQHTQLLDEIAAAVGQLENAENAFKQAEMQRDNLQQRDKTLAAELAAQQSARSAQMARWEQQRRRLEQIGDELADIQEQLAEHNEQIEDALLLKEQAELGKERLDGERRLLEETEQRLQTRQEELENALHTARQQVHTLNGQIESLQAAESLTQKQLQRLQTQHSGAEQRSAELHDKLEQGREPLAGEKHDLEEWQDKKQALETQLKTARQGQEQTEAELTQLAEEQLRVQRELQSRKDALDSIRFEQQESIVRQQTLAEQLQELHADAEQIVAELPEDAEEQSWKIKVDRLSEQLERLGTVNLTAIEEYQAQAVRMDFLNEQHADLSRSLETLTQAIAKIDKESRQRFKETFDKINTGLQQKFPKLFGGGQAYLELADQNVQEAGVNIIARPPGKRNSSIHLLSGGEKALTAVALVFSIFELNPAPFCLLDEVDAPLDDANVGRFSKMVEEMSEAVQFLFISHNKATMEIAKQLAGVTMKEPGVSRMVAVDIEEAVNLAES